MLEAKGDDASNDLSAAQTQVPEGKTRSLLLLRIVLTAQKHQGGSNGGLEDTEEDSRGEQRWVVFGTGRGSSSDAPEGYIDSQPFGRGDLLQQVYCRMFVQLSIHIQIDEERREHTIGNFSH